MFEFEIHEVIIPTSLDVPEAAEFISGIEVGNAVEAIGYGSPELSFGPDEELQRFSDPHHPHRMLVATAGGGIVARGLYETTVGDGADSAWLGVQVLPGFRRRGIGSALAAQLEAMAAAEGKAKLLAYAPVPEGPGERLQSPTGFGSIVVNDDVRFLQRRGYRLEQVERMSRLPLPVEGIDELLAEAQRVSGPDYRVHCWINSTPPQWREDQAVLSTRMSTDAPTAGLEEPEDVWTVERVIENDERQERLNPRTRLRAAVEHAPSGRLVGFTVLSVPVQLHRSVSQFATLVLREHRGHKLGMLLKVANLAQLHGVAPGHPSVITFNAEENRYMLDVNEAVGFVAAANESAWRKDLQ